MPLRFQTQQTHATGAVEDGVCLWATLARLIGSGSVQALNEPLVFIVQVLVVKIVFFTPAQLHFAGQLVISSYFVLNQLLKFVFQTLRCILFAVFAASKIWKRKMIRLWNLCF